MTTVVADAKARVMAADSNTTDGTVKWSSRKIERIGTSLYGGAGNCVDLDEFFAWVRSGKKGRKPKVANEDDLSVIEMDADGILWLWDESRTRYVVGSDFHAVGSGRMAALAAHAMGADAERAVEVACLVDCQSGLPVQLEKL